jgi:hypothetical protein
MMKKITLALFGVALATPALAANPGDQHYSKPKKPHMICKRDESTGSHMSKAVCKTAAEWAENQDTGDEANLGAINREATTRDIGATLSRERPR